MGNDPSPNAQGPKGCWTCHLFKSKQPDIPREGVGTVAACGKKEMSVSP